LARVLGVDWLTPDAFELIIERDGLMYGAGACTLLIRDDQVDSRPYSFSSHPDQPELRFLVKRVSGRSHAGQFSHWLAGRKTGDEVGVGNPFRLFSPGLCPNEIWLATGTGLAPFLSCLRGSNPPRSALLYVGVRNSEEAYFRSFLESRCRVEWRFSRHKVSRRVSVEEPGFPLDPLREYFICGNGAMVRACREGLLARGILLGRVHEESFFG